MAVIETNLTLIFWNTLSNLISNLSWFILFGIIGYLIIKEIRKSTKRINDGLNNLIKNIPIWVSDYEKSQLKLRGIDRALERR